MQGKIHQVCRAECGIRLDLFGHEISQVVSVLDPSISICLGRIPTSIRRGCVHPFSMESSAAANNSSCPDQSERYMGSISGLWSPHAGPCWGLLARACSYPAFSLGEIFLPPALRPLSRPLVPFPELAVVNVSSQLAWGKWVGPTPALGNKAPIQEEISHVLPSHHALPPAAQTP